MQDMRIDEDLLGSRQVPADAYYGVHTVRALENFQISSATIGDVPEMVRGMVMVKKASAMANKDRQTIPADVADAIIAACDAVLVDGRGMDEFPIDVFQGGAGTSVNMNTNVVIANLALEHLGLLTAARIVEIFSPATLMRPEFRGKVFRTADVAKALPKGP